MSELGQVSFEALTSALVRCAFAAAPYAAFNAKNVPLCHSGSPRAAACHALPGRSGQLWTVSQPECLGICVLETRWIELARTADWLQVVSTVQPVFERSGETNGAVNFVG